MVCRRDRASLRYRRCRARKSPPSRACRRTAIIRCRRRGSPSRCRNAATASRARSWPLRHCLRRRKTRRASRSCSTCRATSAAAAPTTRSSPRSSARREKHKEAAMKPGFEGIAFQSISRRAFLISSGTAAVGIAFGSFSKRIFAQAEPFSPNGWVRVEQAPYNPKVFDNPLFGGNMLAGASRTTRGYYEVMRLAGMQARQVMIQSAAQKWEVPATELGTEPHAVVHKASRRKLTYGEIAEFATVPASPPQFTREQLKRPTEFRLIGKDIARIEVPDKVSGQARYGIDVRMLGMLYGAVLRAPVNGEAPLSVDDSEARKVEGVRQIVRMPYGVGVVAETYPAALKAKKALKVEWTQRSKARAYTSEKLIPEYLQRARNLSDKGI